ncbi:MAG: thiamine pyrophosphate-binding protein [Alphaproteobacteria bacterium]|jgi:acetolactate synthase-1/2/3 large subunit|nr:thiamine pyrophosphate-binding protein [Alphaproteobacteria bacterium]
MPVRHGGEIVVDALRRHGCEAVFTVPGESFLGILDHLIDTPEIKLITCRHEAGAAYMAEAYGKLTGKPAVCLVTRGPGACNASIGLHAAKHDSTPMVLLIGHVCGYETQRESFQEIEYRHMFSELSKWVAEIPSADRLPEFVGRAFQLSQSGRPGPVVLAMPEDMLDEEIAIADAPVASPVQPEPSPGKMAELRERLARAERPFLLVGGGTWSDAAVADIVRFAEANGIPAAIGFRRHDCFDMTSPSYAGDLGYGTNPRDLPARVDEADLIVATGTRLNTIITQDFTLLQRLGDGQELVHVHAESAELGRLFMPALGVQAGIAEFAAAAAALEPVDWSARRDWVEAAHAAYAAILEAPPCEAAFDPGIAMQQLADWLPEDAIVTVDAGTYSSWPLRFLRFKRPMRMLSTNLGSMGSSMPAAVAAGVKYPDRTVICCLGDGSMLQTGQELATALQLGSRPIVLVFNNDIYGTIRVNQEARYPGRISATDLTNPDFAALAGAYGAFGEKVERTGDFLPALERARASGRAALIELVLDVEYSSARATLTEIRESGKGPMGRD